MIYDEVEVTSIGVLELRLSTAASILLIDIVLLAFNDVFEVVVASTYNARAFAKLVESVVLLFIMPAATPYIENRIVNKNVNNLLSNLSNTIGNTCAIWQFHLRCVTTSRSICSGSCHDVCSN
jgi:hypothetical protein